MIDGSTISRKLLERSWADGALGQRKLSEDSRTDGASGQCELSEDSRRDGILALHQRSEGSRTDDSHGQPKLSEDLQTDSSFEQPKLLKNDGEATPKGHRNVASRRARLTESIDSPVKGTTTVIAYRNTGSEGRRTAASMTVHPLEDPDQQTLENLFPDIIVPQLCYKEEPSVEVQAQSHDLAGQDDSSALETDAQEKDSSADTVVNETSGTPKPREYSPNEIQRFMRDESVAQLFSIIETYLKHPLSSTDTDTVLFWLDGLHFPIDLIIYLVETCIGRQHKSFRYMNKIAVEWSDKQILTVEQAKEESSHHSEVYYGVMKAFGISGRNLGESEASMLDKWTKEYAFSSSIILEACRRTMTATHQPSFEYTDRILGRWHKGKVHTMEDIRSLDKDYNASKKPGRGSQSPKGIVKKNSFTNFEQRDYDFEELEKLLLTTTV